MAGITASAPSTGARIGSVAARAPRWLMSWEDWFTLVPALMVYIALAIAVQEAEWVRRFPSLIPTVIGGLVVGLFATRIRAPQLVKHPLAIAAGAIIVMLVAQEYADGASIADRISDMRIRMEEWWTIVRAGDVSNDNLPFVLMVHGLGFLGTYVAAWAIFRWRNAWLAVLPAGIGLLVIIATTDGKPSVPFLVFAIGALFLLARMHLQRQQVRWSRSRVEYPDFISLSAAQLTLALSAVLVIAAWAIPLGKQAAVAENALNAITDPIEERTEPLVRLFHDISGRGGNFHKFGGTLPIRGDVGLGSRILLDAEAPIPGFLRGTSYDEYTGSGWKVSDRDEVRVDAGQLLTAGIEGSVYAERVVTELEVTVSDGEDTLFSLGTPLGTNRDASVELPDNYTGDIERIESRRGLDDGDQYTVVGSVSIATEEQLRAAGGKYPEWVVERYLQTPDDLPDRVRDETARVVEDAETPYDMALAIEAYLRTFEVDFSVPATPPRRDVVDHLLFDLQRGYFDYFSTAMTVMLRTQGVPARIAVGYALDPDDASGNRYAVRKNDAYSWVEVFFPGYGWIDFNPSADQPEGGAGGIGGELFDPAFDEEAPILPLPELSELDPELPGGGLDGALTPIDESGGPLVPWYLVWTLAGLLAVVAATLLGARGVWVWGLRGLEGVPRQWAGIQRLARWNGMPADEHETAREWGRDLGHRIEQDEAAGALSRAYEASRYGPPEASAANEETDEAYRMLRNTLLGRIFRRRSRATEDEPDRGEWG